jgi:hypothetical protein
VDRAANLTVTRRREGNERFGKGKFDVRHETLSLHSTAQ